LGQVSQIDIGGLHSSLRKIDLLVEGGDRK
jgi:hypothetical protein